MVYLITYCYDKIFSTENHIKVRIDNKAKAFRYRKKLCINVAICLISLLICVKIWNTYSVHRMKKCFGRWPELKPNIKYFDDIMQSTKMPRKGRSIFFHETSCSDDGIAKLDSRQACAIESAARANPTRDVFVLFTSPVGFRDDSTFSEPLFQALQSYPNIYVRNCDLWNYTRGTPVHDWVETDDLFSSRYIVAHTSDLLRLVTMFKFGGIYLDLDVVVQKTFDDRENNFAGAETKTSVNNAVLGFDHAGYGHEIATKLLT